MICWQVTVWKRWAENDRRAARSVRVLTVLFGTMAAAAGVRVALLGGADGTFKLGLAGACFAIGWAAHCFIARDAADDLAQAVPCGECATCSNNGDLKT